ncbi:hypothetical protein GOP47_0017694 [Adiantum capillus-veneris]|uniref:Uncharacterized protein n=1 Tax=Adiantum capillus-veneris TaxID=13818 RepID=A0A9D4ZC14_ADICA|nr:hypothetical protein GOP47_0017694 [Adiantum capillus-veneris]
MDIGSGESAGRRKADVLAAAREASRAALKAAGCQNAADFFATLSSLNEQAGHVEGPLLAFKTILLMEDFDSLIRYVNLVFSFIEEDHPNWGTDALLLDLSELAEPEDRQRLLHALASIPPFSTLCLCQLRAPKSADQKALSHALSSSNFTSLVLFNVSLMEQAPAFHNRSLRTLSIAVSSRSFYERSCPYIVETLVLPSLSSLTSLTLYRLPLTPSHVHHLFSSLVDNLSLSSLSLTRSLGDETWPRTVVLDSLRRNGVLHKVDLVGTPLEEDAAIAEQLRKNAQNAGRVKLLRAQGMGPVRPSTTRLYLCGLPYSGKTSISRSLAKWSKGSISRWFLPRHISSIRSSDRTRGIEVTVVESQQEHVRISIWDMAGQLQYHSFHDSMLPDLNDRATPPPFLYVWNPFKIHANGEVERDVRGRKARKDLDQFKTDLKYWLKFIASKTSKSQLFKPNVIVVITRADLGLPDMRLWLRNACSALQKQFEEYIYFDAAGFFQVDARDPQNMSKLASHLFKCTKTILSKAPDDFKVCVQARELFENFICSREIPPLITKERPVSKWDFSWVRGPSKTHELNKVSGYAVVKLLMGLRLACPRDYNQEDSDIFIPATLSSARGRIRPSKYLKLDESCATYSFIGRRWSVADSNCTFLTPGIFPLVQVTFHNNLSTQEIHVDLDQDVMAFAFEEDICSSRGIPGVNLVQSVIQPAGIQELKEARDRKAVLIQVLRDGLVKHIQNKGIKFSGDGIGSIIYTWQSETLVDDLVVSLLGEKEVTKLVQSYRASLSEAASHVLLELSDGVGDRGTCKEQQRPEFGSSPSHRQRESIYDKLCDVEVMTRGGFMQLAHQVEDLRRPVLSKLHEIFTYLEDGEAGKLPRMCVVTQDVRSVRRLVLKIIPGLHNLRLELLCECRNQPCHVDGQHGLSIATLDDGLLKRGLSYIDGFLRVAQVVAKIGAHVAVGYGDIIPDFACVLAGIVDAQAFGSSAMSLELIDDIHSPSRVDFPKGQQWLFDVLSHFKCTKGDQIYTQFGLRRIRYADARVAWVCDKHYSGGVPFPI